MVVFAGFWGLRNRDVFYNSNKLDNTHCTMYLILSKGKQDGIEWDTSAFCWLMRLCNRIIRIMDYSWIKFDHVLLLHQLAWESHTWSTRGYLLPISPALYFFMNKIRVFLLNLEKKIFTVFKNNFIKKIYLKILYKINFCKSN